MKIYLDACCVNRPFDDQAQDRIRLETEAVLIIMSRFESGELDWISSEILEDEILRTPDSERRNRALLMTGLAKERSV